MIGPIKLDINDEVLTSIIDCLPEDLKEILIMIFKMFWVSMRMVKDLGLTHEFQERMQKLEFKIIGDKCHSCINQGPEVQIPQYDFFWDADGSLEVGCAHKEGSDLHQPKRIDKTIDGSKIEDINDHYNENINRELGKKLFKAEPSEDWKETICREKEKYETRKKELEDVLNK